MSCITAGELCAACTSVRKWCRAKVMRVIKQNRSEDDAENRIGQGRDEVELFLIDYGKLAKAKVKFSVLTLTAFCSDYCAYMLRTCEVPV